MIMKKLSEEHYIVMDDSEPEIGEWVYSMDGIHQWFGQVLKTEPLPKKITQSTQPLDCACSNKGYKLNTNCAERNRCFDKVQYLPLQEVKELLGVVDVEKKAKEYYQKNLLSPYHGDTTKQDYIDIAVFFYNQALEDNKERKYTEEDLADAINMARNEPDMSGNAIIKSIQPPTEWEVEFVDGKLKLK